MKWLFRSKKMISLVVATLIFMFLVSIFGLPIHLFDSSQATAALSLVFLMVMALEIFRCKRLEQALMASEEQYRLLIDHANEAIYVVQQEKIMFANAMFAQITGLSEAAIVGTSMYHFLAPEHHAQVGEHHRQLLRGEIEADTTELPVIVRNGVMCWVSINAVRIVWHGQPATLNFATDITARKRAEEELRHQMNILSTPIDDPIAIQFSDLFNIEDIQHIQDHFAAATGVASIITQPDGTPITRPSNFCRLCVDVIRKTEKGRINCYKSDAELGRQHPEGPIIQPCLSGGLWDAGASISIAGQHIANWLIGQVRNDAQDENSMLQYADEIGADREVFKQALAEVTIMSKEQFGNVSQALFAFANELSLTAYQNVQQARFISELKRAEEALSAEKERLAVTLRSIGDGVISTDTSGNVVIMNKVAEELCGWRQHEAQGQPLPKVLQLIDAHTRQPCANPVEKVLTSGGMMDSTNQPLLVSRTGNERIIAESGAPIMDKNGVTIGMILVFRDITEKQKLIEHLQRNDKLDSLGVLAGGIAHDFNNLLGGIFGYLDMAREHSRGNDTVIGYLDKALSVFNRAKDLTQQLLTFSKGGAPTRTTGDLRTVITKSATFALSGTPIASEYQIAADLWHCDFDENQIAQVIDNMVINAQQAMPTGGKIVISAQNVMIKPGEHPPLKGGMFIKISIADNGGGIPPDVCQKIFDPFFTTKPKGNGLGLTTCYSIIQRHEGSIKVESEVGGGTTFHIFLPACAKTIVPASVPATVTHHGIGRILVMDDEMCIREIVGEILTMMGYTMVEAKNGEEALQRCAEASQSGQPLVAAIFDLTIPAGLGGKETIGKLRRDFPDLPVFASSGYSADPVMSQPTAYGFNDSLCKPFRPQQLVEMLNRHLGRG